MIDLADPTNTCVAIADYPIALGYSSLGLVDGVVKSCGGFDEIGHNVDNCFDYDKYTNEWISRPDMLHRRGEHRSSNIEGVWLISGDNSDTVGRTTEMWQGSEFVQGPDMPQDMYGHCQVTINSTHIFFVDIIHQTTFMLEWSTEEWTQLDDMRGYRDHGCGCGLIRNEENGEEIVVAGYGSSEIFNLVTMKWRDGPDLHYAHGYASAQLEDTFLMVGGHDNYLGVYFNTILMFDQENYEFVELEQRVQYRRSYAAAIAVPDDVVNC